MLERIADLVHEESGIRLRPNQHASLRSAVTRLGWNPEDVVGLAEDPACRARLVDEVLVKETSFLRDRAQLDAIPWSRTSRVWSVGCASGEEPYTLALLAAEAGATADVLGTDLSATALAAARAGRYRPRAVRAVEPLLRERYFVQDRDRLAVGERLRRSVRFVQHNVVRGPVPPAGETGFDLIVCRNVLIYFDGETAEQVVAALESALRAGGTLVLGAADVLCGTARRLERVRALE
ncbi:MAG: CheR family methyltransferase [Gaiellaceae bacterium]